MNRDTLLLNFFSLLMLVLLMMVLPNRFIYLYLSVKQFLITHNT